MITKLVSIASVVLLVFAVAITGVAAHGQVLSTGGSIQGTIMDESGAVVPGASVDVLGVETGSRQVVKTDSAGIFSVGPLNPGEYKITVTMGGFQNLVVNTVVKTGTVTSGNYKLVVGQSTETVEVNAGALQVNTEQIGVSDVINREQIETLPVNGRNFLDLAQIQPGVILQNGESFDPTKAGYSALSVSGVSGRTTRILLDGQDITDETVGTTIFNVSTGAISDFQLNRATQDVSGDVTSTGQVMVSTRSGTNGFHGEAFYLFQDHSVGFARAVGGYDAPFQRNQFGGSVGGPILRDKLFFFANAERIKQESPKAIAMDPTFAAIQAAYPSIPSPYRQTYSTIRLDYSGPHAMHFFFRANYNVDRSSSNFGAGYEIYNNRDNTPGFAGGMDFAKGHFQHSFRLSYAKFHNLLLDGTEGNSSVYTGFPGLNFRIVALGLYSGPNVDAPQNTFQSGKQFRYDGNWLKGQHNIRYGYSINRILGGGFANFFGLAPRATMTSGTLLTGVVSSGNPLGLGCKGVPGAAPCKSDPVNGYRVSSLRTGNGEGFFTENPGFNLPGGGLEDWRQGAYIADTWKVTPSFTLTAGVRWSVDTDRQNQDLPAPLCSDVTVTPAPCSGSSPLLEQIGPGLGQRVHQPYANFGPQLGFAFSPGDHKTVVRAAFGIFYESNPFNNTTNLRGPMIKKGLFFNSSVICGGANSLLLPDGTTITSDGGVPFSTFCGQPLSLAGPHFISVQKTYQASTQKVGPASNGSYIGNTLATTGIYGAPFRTPYSTQWNGGVQREFRAGMILSVDYIHNSTLKVAQPIDMNHVGAARTLNTAAAKNAIVATLVQCAHAASIAATLIPGGCPGGSGVGPNGKPNNTATIADYAGNGLDSGNTYLSGGSAYANGLTPATGAAFPGINPAFGNVDMVMPTGRSGYDALQFVFRQQKAHPAPGVLSSNFQISYNLSRIVSTVPLGNGGVGDQFFITQNGVYNNDNTTVSMGRSSLDHTHQISFGGSATFKYGPQVGLIGHFYSAAPADLTLDPAGSTGAALASIYSSDVNGDGLLGDLIPGTNPGWYMHEYKGNNLNNLITRYNASFAGQPTPAGLALVNAGLLTSSQLTQLQAVQQPIAPLASPTALNNAWYRAMDLSFAYPIRFNKIREALSLVPSVSFYNLFNFSNFTNYQAAQGATLLGNATVTGPANGLLNGPNTFAIHDANRVQRGSGTSDIGGPRSTEFALKLNF